MREALLNVLRCPFCGTRFSLVENNALVRHDTNIASGVLGCECCAFPVVAGIPVLIVDDRTREVMHALEAGRHEAALFAMLGLDDDVRANAFRELINQSEKFTYRDALDILSLDAEGTYFVYRFSDPTYVSAEALLRSLGQLQWTVSGLALDLCGGSGHLTRVLSSLQPSFNTTNPHTVLADLYFWKLWLATHFTAPDCAPVCCDANNPLPFCREVFSFVMLVDAFHYLWHKRLVADEMIRVAKSDSVVVLPHLHNARDKNINEGNPLTPESYCDLFDKQQPRLFSDEQLLVGILQDHAIDLTASVSPMDLDMEPSLTMVASRRDDLFRRYDLNPTEEVRGVVMINPLYRVERRGKTSVLTLSFPSAEYADEFQACRRYLPETVTVDADLTTVLSPTTLGHQYDQLRRRGVLLDLPMGYL